MKLGRSLLLFPWSSQVCAIPRNKRQSIELIVDAVRRLSKKLGYRDNWDASETIPETASRSLTKSQAKVADN
jgi:hypothetical protein